MNILHMKNIILLLGILLLAGCSQSPEKPNIILIMTDDQGFGDIGFNGNPVIKTPALDALKEQSVNFTQFYVSPVCAPTRSSLMTGRQSIKTGV